MTSKFKSLTHLHLIFLVVIGVNGQDKPVHHENHYHLSAFTGYTTDYAGRRGYKLGIEYEYRLSDHFGLGGTFDFTGADYEIFSLSVGTSIYPFKFPLIFGLGFGAKRSDDKWKEFSRGLILYDLHFDNFSIGPLVMYDFFPERKDIMSYGLTVGFGF